MQYHLPCNPGIPRNPMSPLIPASPLTPAFPVSPLTPAGPIAPGSPLLPFSPLVPGQQFKHLGFTYMILQSFKHKMLILSKICNFISGCFRCSFLYVVCFFVCVCLLFRFLFVGLCILHLFFFCLFVYLEDQGVQPVLGRLYFRYFPLIQVIL